MLVVGVLTDTKQFFHSYLFGYVFALDIALGALFWVLIHHVADAGWSVGLRRVFENMNRAIIPLAVLFLPVLIGTFTGNLHTWYGFVHGEKPSEEHLAHLWHVKHIYFSTPFFLGRLALYFAVWIGVLGRNAALVHEAGRGRRGGADAEDAVVGTVGRRAARPHVHVLRVRHPDEPAILVVQHDLRRVLLGRRDPRFARDVRVNCALTPGDGLPLRNTITMEHLHDVAKIMFGFTVFWAYIGFAQYFLIWYGNMPEETQFYLLRRNGSWNVLSILLPILYFVVPFFMLLPRAHKRSPKWLALIATWVLVMHAYDLYWQIMPVLHQDTVHLHWLDFAAPVFMFGVLIASTAWGFLRLPLIPIRDARLNETIGYENETP